MFGEFFCVSESFWYRKIVVNFSSHSTENFRTRDVLLFVSTCLRLAETALACFRILCRRKQLGKKKIRCDLENKKKNRKKNEVPTKVKFLSHVAPTRNRRRIINLIVVEKTQSLKFRIVWISENTREWILANQRRIRFCVGGGGGINFELLLRGGGLTEKIPAQSQRCPSAGPENLSKP